MVKSIKDTFMSIAPVVLIIFILQAIFAPMHSDLLLRFGLGAALVILGLSIFNLGVTTGMEPMGAEIGSGMTRSRNLWIVSLTGFLIGFVVTLAEPDLQVLTQQVEGVSQGAIPPVALLICVSAGVGIMLVIALLRVMFQWKMRNVLYLCYGLVFLLAIFTPAAYMPIAFDSGGVTTGPMTVPFILSMGVGISSLRTDRNTEADSFGLVGLVSIGPIMAILILGVVTQYV